MAITDNFRRQHVELGDAVRLIEAMLDPQKLAAGAGEARRLLSSLMGKLSIHLAMEDKSLYPRLEQHADATVRDTAKRFAGEMSGVKPTVEAFGRKWSEAQIRADAAGFCAEAKQFFGVLADRIKREETQFYVLVDKAG